MTNDPNNTVVAAKGSPSDAYLLDICALLPHT